MKKSSHLRADRTQTGRQVGSYTKRPWIWDGKPSAEIRNAKGEMVAMVSLRKPSRPEIDHDAALIAAAPDLLVALKALVSVFDAPTVGKLTPERLKRELGSARAALAKAEY
jgi:hypothetical protein